MEDLHTIFLLEQYDELLETFKKLQEIVDKNIRDTIEIKNKMFITGIESRIKKRNSLIGKLNKKGKKYNNILDITDILGARIITFYEDEVDEVATIIEDTFKIDRENSIDKRTLLEIDRFGYMSMHYVCSLKECDENIIKNYPDILKIRFEIQIRTALQHVWATVFHDSGYKSDIEVPTKYIRKLNRLAGLLELADDEFKDVRDDINNYKAMIKKYIENKEFEKVPIDIDAFKHYLVLEPFKNLIDKIASKKNADVVYDNIEIFYVVYKNIGLKTLQDIENMIRDCSDETINLSMLQMKDKDIDIFAQTMVLRNLSVVYVVKNGGSERDILNVYNIINGNKDDNRDLALKILEQTKFVIGSNIWNQKK